MPGWVCCPPRLPPRRRPARPARAPRGRLRLALGRWRRRFLQPEVHARRQLRPVRHQPVAASVAPDRRPRTRCSDQERQTTMRGSLHVDRLMRCLRGVSRRHVVTRRGLPPPRRAVVAERPVAFGDRRRDTIARAGRSAASRVSVARLPINRERLAFEVDRVEPAEVAADRAGLRILESAAVDDVAGQRLLLR